MLSNKKIMGKSRFADCMAVKSFFGKIKEKYELEVIGFHFLID